MALESDLTRAEASELVTEINALFDSLYVRLVEFHERKGYIALGYESFAACAYDVFRLRPAMLYRYLNAAQHTQALGVPVLPEHATVLNGVAEDKRGKVIEVATQLAKARGRDTFTAGDLQRAAQHVTKPSLFRAHIERGDVTAVQALQAEDAIEQSGNALSWLAQMAASYNLHNVKAITALGERWHAGSETCRGIAVSGCLTIENGVQVELKHATRELVEQAWEVAANGHAQTNRDYARIQYVGLHTVDAKAAAATLRRVFDSGYLKQLVKELGNV